MATSRWLRWSRPPWESGRPSSVRTIVTRVVSKIGRPIMAAGTSSTKKTSDAISRVPSRAMPASMKPRNMLPESPMKIRAGLKL